MFFATQFMHVCALDGSDTAIATCIANSDERGVRNIDFIHALIDEPHLSGKIEDKMLKISQHAPIYIYSRFFLHSINEQDEDQLIKLIDKLLENRRGGVFMEFRTKEDETLSKYTGAHFRRYVNPETLIMKFSRLGFKVKYHVEGTGFAKYKTDDAHVARLFLAK
jgi:tellurite methyltransferase